MIDDTLCSATTYLNVLRKPAPTVTHRYSSYYYSTYYESQLLLLLSTAPTIYLRITKASPYLPYFTSVWNRLRAVLGGFAGSEGKYLFHRVGWKGRIWQPCQCYYESQWYSANNSRITKYSSPPITKASRNDERAVVLVILGGTTKGQSYYERREGGTTKGGTTKTRSRITKGGTTKGSDTQPRAPPRIKLILWMEIWRNMDGNMEYESRELLLWMEIWKSS